MIDIKYDFISVEKDRYALWLNKGYFNSLDFNKKPFCIVIPPPNVTGKLHLGHAWDNTLQDIIIRRKRMQGYDTLYLPGMDHAGIATQAKVEERLKKLGTSRHIIGREAFLKYSWEWKEEYASFIRKQWARLGISVDYRRERFTLDSNLNKAVNHVFITLYHKGLIYRGNRIINWDVEAKTALSNIEVEYEEEKGFLYYLKYPYVDGSGYLVIATTRPETCFADQALMVNPNDQRYLNCLGKKVFIPGTKTAIPVIADSYVDIAFGTGVVKVTPAHDPNDFLVGLRHHLKMPLCMSEDGTMNELAGKYQGLDRFECRQKLVNDLKELKLFERADEYIHSVGRSERTRAIVEPRLSLQWFLKMEELASKAIKTDVNFVPKRFKKTYLNWLANIQDWCISRQLWWGHQIPAWYKGEEVKVQVTSPGEGFIQDGDVLDTWFSSALWPFSTLGFPELTTLYERYYPTDVLVTGYDIIFFWVTRMIFQGLEFTSVAPFRDCLIHGLIRASDGRKMSKSFNNGIDPMSVADKYGMDSLRYFLATNSAPGADLRYDEQKVESSWNFINKLWNIIRFISLNVTKDGGIRNNELDDLGDKWILGKLNLVIKEADSYFDKYEFGEASKILYNFIWDDFASWYIELSKIALKDLVVSANKKAILLYISKAVLKLLHPFIPFVTEKLYLEISSEETIMTSSWPVADFYGIADIDKFNLLIEIITKVRNFKNENGIAPKKAFAIWITGNKENIAIITQEERYLKELLFAKSLDIKTSLNTSDETVLLVTNAFNINILKSDCFNVDTEINLLLKQKEHLDTEIARSLNILNNPNFQEKAKPEKVLLETNKHQEYLKQHVAILEKLKEYGI